MVNNIKNPYNSYYKKFTRKVAIGIMLRMLMIYILYLISSSILTYFLPSPYENYNKYYSFTINNKASIQGNPFISYQNASKIFIKIDLTGIIGQDCTYKKVEEILLATFSKNSEYSNIQDFFNDKEILGIILYIDTLGGYAISMQKIYTILNEIKETFNLPIYCFTEGFCTSAGLYLAYAGDMFFSTDYAILGSIGTISNDYFNFYHLMEKIGIKHKTFYEGANIDELSQFSEWKEDMDTSSMDDIINQYYDDFVSIVSEKRNISKDEIINKIGAKIFSGKESKKIGLVDDTVASYNEFIELLCKEKGISIYDIMIVQIDKKSYYNFFTMRNQFNQILNSMLHLDFNYVIKYIKSWL